MTGDIWKDSSGLLFAKEVERRARREAFAARAETAKHWAAGVGIFLFIGTVIFIACAA